MPLCGRAQLSVKQEAQVDSLKRVIKTAKHDTTIINAWIAWDNIIYAADPELDWRLNQKIDSLCSINLKKSLSAKTKKTFLKSKSFALNSMGIISVDQGNYAKAIDFYTKSLKIYEEIDFKTGIAASSNNIGVIYKEQKDFAKAIEYYNKSLKIFEDLGDQYSIASSFNNIGNIYQEQGKLDLSINYYIKSLKIYEELDDNRGVATSLNNIGLFHKEKSNYTKALTYYARSLKIREEIGDKKGIANSYNNIGSIHFEQGNASKSLEFGTKALSIARETGATIEIESAAELLWKANNKLGKYKDALENYELYIATKTSLENEENQKAVIRQEYKYQYEKQAATDSIKAIEKAKIKNALLIAERAENKKNKLEAEQQKQRAYYLFGGLALALIFGGFIFNRFRVTSKQKKVIEQQKEKVDASFVELEVKNKEIMDSINYAKRIQNAILPSEQSVKALFPQSFILYKPKDVVAGDFYWLEQKGEKILFAAADCTGHGVPGAMVSVVCNNGLNRSVREHDLTDPGKILDKTREIVIEQFEKSEDEVQDGMDIALCCVEGNTLKYAGAHNPLWIVRQNTIIEFTPDKQPIGKFDHQLPYTTHTIELEKGDSIYLFSDGYVDQFGGEKGKKFKASALRTLLLSFQDKTMDEQHALLNSTFEKWRGDLEQVDDVCVFGVRI